MSMTDEQITGESIQLAQRVLADTEFAGQVLRGAFPPAGLKPETAAANAVDTLGWSFIKGWKEAAPEDQHLLWQCFERLHSAPVCVCGCHRNMDDDLEGFIGVLAGLKPPFRPHYPKMRRECRILGRILLWMLYMTQEQAIPRICNQGIALFRQVADNVWDIGQELAESRSLH